ncbi:HNH endonuclease [Aureispira anguillae]|nr:HNH endonuclease [Aureispira anguillae]
MGCNRGKASPNAHVKLQLFADSGGYCQKPDCNASLFLSIGDDSFHIAEMAHIFSASNKGPRSNNTLTKEDRGKFDNLILLCPTCHTIIDKAEEQYPDSLISLWKKEHSEKINNLFNIKSYTSRKEVRKLLNPLMVENKTVFNIYGPMTDQRFNPESEMPYIWIRKIHKTLLPNNRKIINIIDKNYDLLDDVEIETVELFRQHVKDFEDKHLNQSDINGIQFPIQMNDIYK